MTKQFNRKVGYEGEEIAAKFLLDKGYKILERNYHTRFGEIDLIVCKNNILSFVEVKLKHGEDFGTPEEMIGKFKLSQVQRMAEFYLMDKPNMAKIYKTYLIDAVCIVGGSRVTHYENLTF
ncbi:MAG: YraN family protein [Patescibacteria group bacterium]